MKRLLGVLVLGLALLAPGAAQAAKPAKVTGKLTGAKLPSASNGRVVVWALRLSNGVAVDSAVAKRGRFSLETPKGGHAILATVVPERGRKPAVHRVAAFVTAKAGKRTKLRKATLKKPKKRPRASAAARARAAWVNVDYPMLWVHRFGSSGDPELKVLETGMRDMLITDLVQGFDGGDCRGGVSAGDDLPLVMAEIKRTQSPQFDPSTRMTTRNLIRANAHVTGTVTRANGQYRVTATYAENVRGRAPRTTTVSATGSDVFSVETQVAQKLLRFICGKVPKTYTGTFSGSWTTTLNSLTVTWTGDAVLELSEENGQPPPVESEPGTWANYVVRSGRVHAKLEGSRGTCTVAGEVTFDLPTGTESGLQYVQTGVDRPWFHLGLYGRGSEQIPYTETGTGCNQQDPAYPLTFVPYAFTELPLQSGDGLTLTGNTSMRQYSDTSHFTSSFSFVAGD